jgi:hypothetical protein
MLVAYLIVIIYYTMLFVTMGLACLWGKRPEYIGAAVMVFGSIFSALATSARSVRFRSMEVGVFTVDLIMLLLFGWLALTSKRFWPIWVTGFHLCAILTHITVLLMPESLPLAYYHLQGKFAYLMCGSILMGAYGQRALDKAQAA